MSALPASVQRERHFIPQKIGEFGKGLAEWFPSWSHTTIVVAAKKNDAVYPPPNLTDLIY